jgi:hypothetical protein
LSPQVSGGTSRSRPGPAEQLEGAPVVVEGLPVPALARQDLAQVEVAARLAGVIARRR